MYHNIIDLDNKSTIGTDNILHHNIQSEPSDMQCHFIQRSFDATHLSQYVRVVAVAMSK